MSVTALGFIATAQNSQNAARDAADGGDFTAAMVLMQSASVSALIAVAVSLSDDAGPIGDLAKIATRALAVLVDERDVEQLAELRVPPKLPSIPPRADLVEQLTEIFRETYEASNGQLLWPALATAALEFMEDTE